MITEAHERKWVAFSKTYHSIVDFDVDLEKLALRVGNIPVVYRKIPPSGVYISPSRF